jgi:hypothetical protein
VILSYLEHHRSHDRPRGAFSHQDRPHHSLGPARSEAIFLFRRVPIRPHPARHRRPSPDSSSRGANQRSVSVDAFGFKFSGRQVRASTFRSIGPVHDESRGKPEVVSPQPQTSWAALAITEHSARRGCSLAVVMCGHSKAISWWAAERVNQHCPWAKGSPPRSLAAHRADC